MMFTRIALVAASIAASAAAQVVAPFDQTFDGFASALTTLVPGVGTTALGPSWDFAVSDCAGHARIASHTTIPNSFVAAPPIGTTPANGPKVLILDRYQPPPTGCTAPVNGFTTNTLVLHIDGTASDLGAGFTITIALCEIQDESQDADAIVLTDGVTTGNGVTRFGASTSQPGYGSHKEVLLLDWNAAGVNGTWKEFTFLVNSGFLAANGLVLSNDMRLVVRQNDNLSTANVNDGLAVDAIRVRSVTTGTGQAPQFGLAVMDLNGSVEMNGYAVSTGVNGPYSVSVASGATLAFSFSGMPGQPVVLLAGPLGPNVATFPGIGVLDIGTAAPFGPPANVTVLADGAGSGGLSPFFRLDAAGNMNFTITSSALPVGSVVPFQTAVYTGGAAVIALSNAVVLNIQ